jgi:hypothetical protein
MAKGAEKPTFTKKILCMGCGKYFAKHQLQFIDGIPFCDGCKAAAGEFKNTLQAERDSILSQQGLPISEEDKWERAWSSKDMVNITPQKLAKLPHPIPINGLQAPLWSRIYGRLLDYVFVGFGLMILDMIFHLSVMASWIFGDLGIQPKDYQYSNLLDPEGQRLLFSNMEVLRKIALFAFLFAGLYRLLFFILFRRTLGQSFAGVMYTDARGHFPGIGSRFVKAIVSSLSDAALIGPAIDAVVYSVSRPQACVSDAVAGMRAVRYDRWKGMAADILHRMSEARWGGGPTQKSFASEDL